MATRSKPEEEQKSNEQQQPPAQEQESGRKYPQYLEAAARIPSSWQLGAPRTDNNLVTIDGVPHGFNQPVPGIMVIDYIPTLGVSESSGSPLNRAMEYQFNRIRAGISGNRPYQPADHMIYRVAIESMYDLYDYVKRIYRSLFEYKVRNRYLPRYVLQAMGIDVDDWAFNISNLYFWLHAHARDLVAFPMVKLGQISDRHAVYNGYFFKDGEADSAQTYVINQRAFWSYEVVDEVKGLTPRAFPSTFRAFTTMWEEMRFALVNSTDAAIIAADIRRVYENETINTFEPPASVDERVEYKKLDPVLLSIMNAVVLPFTTQNNARTAVLNNFRVTDDAGQLKCTPVLHTHAIPPTPAFSSTSWGVVTTDHLNSVSETPTTADFVSMVRLKPHIEHTVTGGMGLLTFKSMGTELIVGARMACLRADTNTLHITECGSALVAFSNLPTTAQDLTDHFGLLADLSTFDWHFPVVFALADGESSTNMAYAYDDGNYSILEDIQNYIPISRTNLDQIHESILLMEFGLES